MVDDMQQTQISQDILQDNCDYQSFVLAYYDRVANICRRFARDENEKADLVQEFFAKKVLQNDIIAKYRMNLEKRLNNNQPRIPFRRFIFRAVTNFCIEKYRQETNSKKPKELNQDPVEFAFEINTNHYQCNEDLVYDLTILHRALTRVRNFYEEKGKLHYWLIYKESVLDRVFGFAKANSSAGQSVENVEIPDSKEFVESIRRKYLPDSNNNQDVYNIQSTVKRFLCSTLDMIFEAESDHKDDPEEKNRMYHEWLSMFIQNDESLFLALNAALRVGPAFNATESSMKSMSIAMAMDLRAESEIITAEEIGYLLTYRLDMPLTEWLDSRKLIEIIPAKSPFIPARRPSGIRPLSLALILEPDPAEEQALEKVGIVELLRLVKDHSKSLAGLKEHPVPTQIFTLFYTLVSAIAIYRYRTRLHSIDDAMLRNNINWYLKQEWLDPRVKRLFKTVLSDPAVW